MGTRHRKYRKKLGERTYHGNKKKRRGKGVKGGKGKAGKFGTRELMFLKLHGPEYFKKRGFKRPYAKKLRYINVEELEKFAKEHEGKLLVELPGYKVLGAGEIKKALVVKASAFSDVAREKIERAGGKALVI